MHLLPCVQGLHLPVFVHSLEQVHLLHGLLSTLAQTLLKLVAVETLALSNVIPVLYKITPCIFSNFSMVPDPSIYEPVLPCSRWQGTLSCATRQRPWKAGWPLQTKLGHAR